MTSTVASAFFRGFSDNSLPFYKLQLVYLCNKHAVRWARVTVFRSLLLRVSAGVSRECVAEPRYHKSILKVPV